MANHAIIVAAGTGKRFGGKKQFYPVHGRPLFVYATSVFETHRQIHSIILVVPKRQKERIRKLVKTLGLSKVRHVVSGGQRRQDSVINGLRAIKDKAGVVVIHDAARPLISKKIIGKGIALCRKHKSVILGVKVRDTVKRVAKRRVQETVPRNGLFLIQTPQFYDLRTIRKVITAADPVMEYTDEAAVFESLGLPVYLFTGDPHNMKVTDKQDLKIMEKLLL